MYLSNELAKRVIHALEDASFATLAGKVEEQIRRDEEKAEHRKLYRQKRAEGFRHVLYDAIKEHRGCTATELFYYTMNALNHPSFPKVVGNLRQMVLDTQRYEGLTRVRNGRNVYYYVEQE